MSFDTSVTFFGTYVNYISFDSSFITSMKKDEIVLALKSGVVEEKGQRVALSKKENMRWRLTAIGTIK